MAIVLTDRHNGARCNLDQRGFLLGALRVIIRSFYFNVNIIAHAVDGSKQNKTLCVSVCVCVYAAIISALKKQ